MGTNISREKIASNERTEENSDLENSKNKKGKEDKAAKDFSIEPWLPENKTLGYGNYKMYNCETINVLLVGRAQAGKTTLLRSLVNPHVGVQGQGFSSTIHTEFCTFVLKQEGSDKVYQLNIIDTPGLNEMARSGKSRSDKEIFNLSCNLISNSITNLNIVAFVSIAGKTHLYDIEVFKVLKLFLGEGYGDISMMLLTHCDNFGEERVQEFEDEIKNHPASKGIYEYCKLGIHRFGAIDIDHLTQFPRDETRKDVVEAKLTKNEAMRNKLFDTWISLAKTSKPVKELQEIKKESDCMVEKIVDEKLHKMKPSDVLSMYGGCIIS